MYLKILIKNDILDILQKTQIHIIINRTFTLCSIVKFNNIICNVYLTQPLKYEFNIHF